MVRARGMTMIGLLLTVMIMLLLAWMLMSSYGSLDVLPTSGESSGDITDLLK